MKISAGHHGRSPLERSGFVAGHVLRRYHRAHLDLPGWGWRAFREGQLSTAERARGPERSEGRARPKDRSDGEPRRGEPSGATSGMRAKTSAEV